MSAVRKPQVLETPDAQTAECPYPGPVPFCAADGARFFGREREVRTLLGQLLNERIVVLHGPSGAGKSSLIEAGLRPAMEKEGFRVISGIRLNRLPDPETTEANRYVLSALRSIESSLSTLSPPGVGRTIPVEELAHLPPALYLSHREALRTGDEHLLLVFDQFEELFTLDPSDHQGRVEFFTALGAMLNDRGVWAVFVMREEYVAGLDRYTRLVPTHLACRFHLDYLRPERAREAITEPARQLGATFDGTFVDSLLKGLSLTRDEGMDVGLIDPLHLQLACLRLWGKRGGRQHIGPDILEARGKGISLEQRAVEEVNFALEGYIDETLRSASEELALEERLLRYWLVDALTQDRIHRKPSMAPRSRAASPEAIVNAFEKRHILRADIRPEARWYELSHDRLVTPLVRSNTRWFSSQTAGMPFRGKAWDWCSRGEPTWYPASRYLEARRLARERPEPGDPFVGLSPCERRYLDYSLTRHGRLEFGAVALVLLLATALGVGWWQRVALSQAADNVLMLAISEEARKKLEAEIEEKETRLKIVDKASLVRPVTSIAYQQLYQQDNDDIALLLSRFAFDTNRSIDAEGLRQSDLVARAPIWAAMRGFAFSETLPASVLDGLPERLVETPTDIAFTLRRTNGPGTFDVRALGGALQQPCLTDLDANAMPVLSGDGLGFLGVSPDRLQVVRRGNPPSTCDVWRIEPPGNMGIAPDSPIVSADGRLAAIVTTDGDARVYRLHDGGHYVEIGRVPAVDVLADEPPAPGAADNEKRQVSFSCSPGHKGITTLALTDARLATGSQSGVIQVFDITANGLQRVAEIRPWRRGWPHGNAVNKLSRPGDACVIALSIGSDPSDSVTAVHAGATATGGGRVIRYGMAAPGEEHEIKPDLDSQRRFKELARNGSASIKPAGERFMRARFSQSGRRLAIGGQDASVQVWNLDRPRQPGIQDSMFVEEFLDGSPLLPALRRAPAALNAASQSNRDRPEPDIDLARVPLMLAPVTYLPGLTSQAREVLVSSDGKVVAAISVEHNLRLWRIGGMTVGRSEQPWTEHGFIYGLQFRKDHRLVTTNNRGQIQEWEVSSDNSLLLSRAPVEDGYYAYHANSESIRSIDMHPSGVAVLGLGSKQIAVVSPGSKEWLRVEPSKHAHEDGVWAAVFRPDSGAAPPGAPLQIASGDYSGRVVFWNANIAPAAPGGLRELHRLDLEGAVQAMSFHPDGRWLVVGTLAPGLHIIDMEGNRCASSATVASGNHPPPCVYRSYLGDTTFGDRQTFDLRGIRAAAFDDSGKRLVIAGDDGLVAVLAFDGQEGGFAELRSESHRRLFGHRGRVNAVHVFSNSGDSTMLATAGRDGRVGLWEISGDGRRIANSFLRSPTGIALDAMEVSPAGDVLATGSADGVIRLWSLTPEKLVCGLLYRKRLSDREWGRLVPWVKEQPLICDG